MKKKIDFLICGAGPSAIVVANILCVRFGARCHIIEKRDHIAGNCYDYTDGLTGSVIHKYGPHYFRTNVPWVVDFLSRHTEWIHCRYSVSAFAENRFWSFPVNLKTFRQLSGQKSSESDFKKWLDSEVVSVDCIKNSEDAMLSTIGRRFYGLFFHGYTTKQWGVPPAMLDPSVCSRIPFRLTDDDRYFNDEFQALPSSGYTSMFQSMIDECEGMLTIETESDFFSRREGFSARHTIYTGMLDRFFNYCAGHLPYRSLRFEIERYFGDSLSVGGKFFQPTLQVNYTDRAGDFTRTVETKHIVNQDSVGSSVVREFPQKFEADKDPFYPVPCPESRNMSRVYSSMAKQKRDVTFLGRLAKYKYYNMDQVIAAAIVEAKRLGKLIMR